jgi:hypothetical protein
MAVSKCLLPQPNPWAVTAYHNLGDSRFWDRQGMIHLHGTLRNFGPMNPLYVATVEFMASIFQLIFPRRRRLRLQLPRVVDRMTDPFPDFAIRRSALHDNLSRHRSTAALVVATTDSSLSPERTEKRRLDAAATMPDCWVLDLNGPQFDVARVPVPAADGGADRNREQILGPDDTETPLVLPDHRIAVAGLLPQRLGLRQSIVPVVSKESGE